MSQVDRIHFLPTLVWVVGLFLIWYGFIVCWVFPMYYRSLRSRVLLEQSLWTEILNSVYLLYVIKRFFENFTNIIIKFFNLLSIVRFFKNFSVIVLKNNKMISQKRFYDSYNVEVSNNLFEEIEINWKEWSINWVGPEELYKLLKIAKKVKLQIYKKVVKRNYSSEQLFSQDSEFISNFDKGHGHQILTYGEGIIEEDRLISETIYMYDIDGKKKIEQKN